VIDPTDISLPDFLSRWHATPDSSAWHLPDDLAWIPDPLREWYCLAYRWEQFRSVHNQIYKPWQLRKKEGKVEFASDPTGDWFWAFDVEDSSSISVYEAELRGDWRLLSESLSEFLVHATLRQTLTSGKFGRTCSQVPNAVLPRILVDVEDIDFGGWGWPCPGHRILMSESLILDVGPAMDFRAPRRNREGFSSVRVSAFSSESLHYLDVVTSVKWLVYANLDQDNL
jgi:hypothetical protein